MSSWFAFGGLHQETITIQSVGLGAPDSAGVPARTITERVWEGCHVQPVGTTESVGAAQVVTDRLRVSGPLAPWIKPEDTLTRGGRTFEIEGEPQHYTGGVLDHTEIIVRAQKG